jgi:hypothetical protein
MRPYAMLGTGIAGWVLFAMSALGNAFFCVMQAAAPREPLLRPRGAHSFAVLRRAGPSHASPARAVPLARSAGGCVADRQGAAAGVASPPAQPRGDPRPARSLSGTRFTTGLCSCCRGGFRAHTVVVCIEVIVQHCGCLLVVPSGVQSAI